MVPSMMGWFLPACSTEGRHLQVGPVVVDWRGPPTRRGLPRAGRHPVVMERKKPWLWMTLGSDSPTASPPPPLPPLLRKATDRPAAVDRGFPEPSSPPRTIEDRVLFLAPPGQGTKLVLDELWNAIS